MYIKSTFSKILNILEQIARTFSILILFYIFIAHVGHFLVQNTITFDQRVFDTEYLRGITLIALASGIGGSLLATIQNKKNPISFATLENREKVVVTIAAIFFSIFFIGTFTTLLSKILVVILSAFLAFLLPRLIGFYSLVKIKQTTDGSAIRGFTLRNVIIAVFVLSILTAAAYTVFNIASVYLSGEVKKEDELKKTLYIKTITPEVTTHAEIATIEGYNFGWRSNEQYRLMNIQGEIPVSEWTNEKLVFTVPLHLKVGSNDIWVEKPDEKNPRLPLQSNKVKLSVLSRFDFFPLEEDNKLERGFKKIKRTLFFRIPSLNKYLY